MATATVNLDKQIESLDNFKEIVGKFVTRLGDPSQYEFSGEVIDLGQYGNGKCTCDHPIRYMFLIWGPNGKVAPVGCECIKHFQAYNEKLFNKLENARLGLAREKAEATRQVKKAETQPTFELAKERFLAICEMHKKRINFMIPRAMWLLSVDLKKTPEYKTTNGYIKYYESMVSKIENTIEQYKKELL